MIKKLRILFVSRHFNQSGYHILKALIEGNIPPVGVLLKDTRDPWRNPWIRWLCLIIYRIKCLYYRADPCKVTESEELLARKNRIQVYKISSVKTDDFQVLLNKINPELIIVGGGWHELIPVRVLDYPLYGTLNVHPSMLPEFRGTSITRWQILHNVKESGVTIHYMDESFDTGRIIMQEKVLVDQDDTPQQLFQKLSLVAARMMVRLLKEKGLSKPEEMGGTPQDESTGQYFPKWKWDNEHLRIDWSQPLEIVHNFIRANNQESYEYRGPYCYFNKERFIVRKTKLIQQAEFADQLNRVSVGELVSIAFGDNNGLYLQKRSDPHLLHITLVQRYDSIWYLRRAHNPRRWFENYTHCSIS